MSAETSGFEDLSSTAKVSLGAAGAWPSPASRLCFTTRSRGRF